MFIDEAYSLGNDDNKDSFSKECIDTLTHNLTEKRDFLCIIAGYKNSLDKCFFSSNPGLARRFAFRYNIEGYSADELRDIFLLKIKKDDLYLVHNISDHSAGIQNNGNLLELTNFFSKNKKYFPNYGGDIETLILNWKICHGRRTLMHKKEYKKILTMDDVRNGFNVYIKNRGFSDKEDDTWKAMFM